MKRKRETSEFALVRELEYAHKHAILAQWRYERATDEKSSRAAFAAFKRYNLRFDNAAAALRARLTRFGPTSPTAAT